MNYTADKAALEAKEKEIEALLAKFAESRKGVGSLFFFLLVVGDLSAFRQLPLGFVMNNAQRLVPSLPAS